MLSLHNIWTVARYEMKTLLRSWFFRIFSILAILILAFLNLILLTPIITGWMPFLFRGIASSFPYMNILLLNVVQAIIGVFLASDFLKRDKKLDTTEVVYMRSMTNGDYVLGKSLGILIVFIGLNLVVLVIAAMFNIFFSDVSFVWQAYLFYPLFISIPTLVFIFGLSFLFMVTIRNQAVTFIILLGYIAATLFFLNQKLHYIFDYMAFNVPLMYSDFIGFGNISTILIHRGIYLFFGLGFIFATILMIKRLPQSKAMTKASGILSVIFIGCAVLLSGIYLIRLSNAKKLRQSMVELNKDMNILPKVTPINWNLDLSHRRKEIEVIAKLTFQNNSFQLLDKYIFSLNPGLEVQKVTTNQENLKFDREFHIITVKSSNPLPPQAIDSLTLVYKGKPTDEACYLDIDEKTRELIYQAWAYNIAKKFSIIEPSYVLLTPETIWYPIPGIPYGAAYPDLSEKSFINFQLKVQTNKKLTIISQGKKLEIKPGEFIFKPEHPLPQLSLVIGNYEKKSIQVDSIDYNLFNLKGHDYYASYFDEISDTLAALIRDARRDFENNLELTYLYPRLSLVEVPVQFFSYERLWTSHQESVQPEVVLLPEKGLFIDGADFNRMKRWQERRWESRNQTLTPQEVQSNLFNRFIRSTLLESFSGRSFNDLIKAPLNYNIFPNYYTFVNHFHSEQWPIFNIALESFLNEKAGEQSPRFRRFRSGLSDEEKANLALMKQNLSEIMTDPDKKDILDNVLKIKGSYLFKLIQSELDPETFQKFIADILKENHFKNVDVQHFISTLKEKHNFDIEPYFDSWYQERQLPGFVLADLQAYKVLDQDRTRYQVKFKVSNMDSINGLLSLTFRTGGGGFRGFFGRGAQEEPEERFISLAAGETKEIGIVLDDQPRMMMLNTLISKNLPSIIDRGFDELELNEKAKPFDGERVLEEPVKLIQPGEIIVDNEDPGFEVLYQPTTSFLKRLLQSRKKEEEEDYIGLTYWHPPSRWRATTYNDFYGKYIHSAYYVKAGNGDKKVAWNTEIKQSGNYDIYYHSTNVRAPWFRRGRREGGRGSQVVEQFHFLIHHDDGVDEEILDVAKSEGGWSFLGTYYLSEGTARVELTDKSKGRLVFADAVKWVKH